jgi:hypothetical protein
LRPTTAARLPVNAIVDRYDATMLLRVKAWRSQTGSGSIGPANFSLPVQATAPIVPG